MLAAASDVNVYFPAASLCLPRRSGRRRGTATQRRGYSGTRMVFVAASLCRGVSSVIHSHGDTAPWLQRAAISRIATRRQKSVLFYFTINLRPAKKAREIKPPDVNRSTNSQVHTICCP
jgi:hypothetical protein